MSNASVHASIESRIILLNPKSTADVSTVASKGRAVLTSLWMDWNLIG
jgi:hypothetical protein